MAASGAHEAKGPWNTSSPTAGQGSSPARPQGLPGRSAGPPAVVAPGRAGVRLRPGPLRRPGAAIRQGTEAHRTPPARGVGRVRTPPPVLPGRRSEQEHGRVRGRRDHGRRWPLRPRRCQRPPPGRDPAASGGLHTRAPSHRGDDPGDLRRSRGPLAFGSRRRLTRARVGTGQKSPAAGGSLRERGAVAVRRPSGDHTSASAAGADVAKPRAARALTAASTSPDRSSAAS